MEPFLSVMLNGFVVADLVEQVRCHEMNETLSSVGHARIQVVTMGIAMVSYGSKIFTCSQFHSLSSILSIKLSVQT